MKKKYTMQDIANEAGVTKTTVSYVLNNKKEGRISEETRKKVLQVANLFGYVPNLSAKALNQVQRKIIGVIMPENIRDRETYDIYHFIDCLKDTLHRLGYHLLFIHEKEDYKPVDFIGDATLIFNRPDSTIDKVADLTFTPTLIIDNYYESSLFHCVLNNYPQAIKDAQSHFGNHKETRLIYRNLHDQKLTQMIKTCENIIDSLVFTSDEKLVDFIKGYPHSNFIVIGESIGLIAEKLLPTEQLIVITEDSPMYLQDMTMNISFNDQAKAETIANLVHGLITNLDNISSIERMNKLDYTRKNF